MTKRARSMLRQMDRITRSWFLPTIGREKATFIGRLIDKRRPKRAVEIGSLIGYSAIVVAGHLPPGGRLTCIELNPYLAMIAEENLRPRASPRAPASSRATPGASSPSWGAASTSR